MWIFVLKASSFHFKPFLYLELVFSECIKMHFLLFIYFSVALGLGCCTHAFSSCSERGLL